MLKGAHSRCIRKRSFLLKVYNANSVGIRAWAQCPSPLSSQGTCYKEAPLVSRTRVRHQVLRDKEDWRIVVTRMSNPLPSHDPAQLDGPCLLLAGHLNYFKTGTDAAWKSRPAADNWNLSIYALLSLSSPFGYLRK